MKRSIALILTLALSMAMVGCSKESSASTESEQASTSKESTGMIDPSIISYLDQGIEIKLTGEWLELKDNIMTLPVHGAESDPVSGVMVNFNNDEALTKAQELIDKKEEAGNKIEEALWENTKRLYAVAYVKTGEVSIDTVQSLVGGPDRIANITELAVKGDTTFYFCTYPDDIAALSETSRLKYERLFKDLETAKNNIQTSVPKERLNISGETPVSFTTTDFEGNSVSSEIFKEHKLTMLNIWGTFCPPCIEELPDLQELSDEMKEKDVALVGILADAITSTGELNEDNIDLAKTIMEKKNASYLTLMMNKELEKALPTDTLPTTVFVDSNGQIIGDPIYGGMSKEKYKEAIEKDLLSLSK